MQTATWPRKTSLGSVCESAVTMNVLSKVYVDIRETLLPVFVATLRILRLERIARLGLATAKALLPAWPRGGRRIEHPTVIALEDIQDEEPPEQEGGQSPQETGRLLSPCTIDENGTPTYEAIGSNKYSKFKLVDEVKFPGIDVGEEPKSPIPRAIRKKGAKLDHVFDGVKPRMVEVAQSLQAATNDMVKSLVSGDDRDTNPADDEEAAQFDRKDVRVEDEEVTTHVGMKRKESEEWPLLVEPVSKRPKSVEGEFEDHSVERESVDSHIQTAKDGDACRVEPEESSGLETAVVSSSPATVEQNVASDEQADAARLVCGSEAATPVVEESSGLLVTAKPEGVRSYSTIVADDESAEPPSVEESSGLSFGGNENVNQPNSVARRAGHVDSDSSNTEPLADVRQLEESSGIEVIAQDGFSPSRPRETKGLSKTQAETDSEPSFASQKPELSEELSADHPKVDEKPRGEVENRLEESSGLETSPLGLLDETSRQAPQAEAAQELPVSATDSSDSPTVHLDDSKPLLEESSGLSTAIATSNGKLVAPVGNASVKTQEQVDAKAEETEKVDENETSTDNEPHVHFAYQTPSQEPSKSSKHEMPLDNVGPIVESLNGSQTPVLEESSGLNVAVDSRSQQTNSLSHSDDTEEIPAVPRERGRDQTPSWLMQPSYEKAPAEDSTLNGSGKIARPLSPNAPEIVTPTRPHELEDLLPSLHVPASSKIDQHDTNPAHVLETEVHSLSLLSPAAMESAMSMSLFQPKDVTSSRSAYDEMRKTFGVTPQRDRGDSNDTDDTENDRHIEEIDSDEGEEDELAGDEQAGVVGSALAEMLKVDEIPDSHEAAAPLELASASSSSCEEDVWGSDEDESFASVPPFLRKRVVSTVYYTV